MVNLFWRWFAWYPVIVWHNGQRRLVWLRFVYWAHSREGTHYFLEPSP